MASVGARGVVHTPQFNGKQEGTPSQASIRRRRWPPNLRCPRNGKTNDLCPGFGLSECPLFSICH
jgi:hypothetical protein